MTEKIPESLIQDPDKAQAMALAENYYQTMPQNARKAGMTQLAKEFQRRAESQSMKAEAHYDKTTSAIDGLSGVVVDELFVELRNILKTGPCSGGDLLQIETFWKNEDPTNLPDFLRKVKQLLGVASEPYVQGNFLTNIERVIFVENEQSDEGTIGGKLKCLTAEEWKKAVALSHGTKDEQED